MGGWGLGCAWLGVCEMLGGFVFIMSDQNPFCYQGPPYETKRHEHNDLECSGSVSVLFVQIRGVDVLENNMGAFACTETEVQSHACPSGV